MSADEPKPFGEDVDEPSRDDFFRTTAPDEADQPTPSDAPA